MGSLRQGHVRFTVTAAARSTCKEGIPPREMQLKDRKSDVRRRLMTCTALVAVCTWAPLNAASAQVNVVADGTIVDLSLQPTYPNFNSLRAVNSGQITNS